MVVCWVLITSKHFQGHLYSRILASLLCLLSWLFSIWPSMLPKTNTFIRELNVNYVRSSHHLFIWCVLFFYLSISHYPLIKIIKTAPQHSGEILKRAESLSEYQTYRRSYSSLSPLSLHVIVYQFPFLVYLLIFLFHKPEMRMSLTLHLRSELILVQILEAVFRIEIISMQHIFCHIAI